MKWRKAANGVGCGVLLGLFAVAACVSTVRGFHGHDASPAFEGFRDGMAIFGFATCLWFLWHWATEPDHIPNDKG